MSRVFVGMAKTTIDMAGKMNLPVGFRFRPTDEELLVHYLARKVSGLPLPASVIPEFDVFQADPWSLPGNLNERRYFFSRKSRFGNRNKVRRTEAGSSLWKQIGRVKLIKNSNVAGTRKTLLFRETTKGSQRQRMQTRWFLREYGFLATSSVSSSNQTSEVVMEADWVIHCLFQKRRPRKGGWIYQPPKAEVLKLTWSRMKSTSALDGDYGHGDPPKPSSSGTSVITEVRFECEDEEESSPVTRFS